MPASRRLQREDLVVRGSRTARTPNDEDHDQGQRERCRYEPERAQREAHMPLLEHRVLGRRDRYRDLVHSPGLALHLPDHGDNE